MADALMMEDLLAAARDGWDGRIGPTGGLQGVRPGELLPVTFESLRAYRDEIGNMSVPPAVEGRRMPPDLDGLKGHFGWLVDALVTWDPSRTTWLADLETILAALSLWNADGRLWPVLGRLLPNVSDLTVGLAGVLLCRGVSVDLPAGTPVYEREMLDELNRAESSRDWGRMMDLAGRFPIAQPYPAEREAVRGLWELDQDRLVKVANGMDAWMRAAPVVGSLPLEDGFAMVTRSSSEAVRFAVLERAMHREERRLNAKAGTALAELFVALSKEVGWPAWLAAFNRYPVRCPQFQMPLGRALARMDTREIDAYVASLNLRSNDHEGRPLVTRCLKEFHSLAPLEKRCILWRSGFDRWRGWDFAARADGHLTNVATSVLDYAVVGHLLEGGPRRLLVDAEARFQSDLADHENRWHASLSHAITGYNRLVSRFQPYAIAQAARWPHWRVDVKVIYPAAASDLVKARYKGI